MSVALRAPPAPDTVLVVDDDPFMVRLMQRALSQLGITGVSTCASAQTALYELESAQGSPDLILLDLQMPDMDGVQFLRRLAELHYTGALILVSGEELHVLRSIDKLVRAHGIKSLGHLRKPFEPEVFAARIAKWAQANGDERRVSRKVCRPDDLRTAIATGALVNCYQPVVSVSSGELVGVECLLRWPDSTGGMMYPDQFIGVAEQHGLIGDLTSAMLSAALMQSRAWRDAGLALQMAVNVSIASMVRLGFPDMLMSHADAAGVSAESIVVEVTESRLMANQSTALDVFNRLRLKHFHLLIDEFGTRHSSLAQLRDIPFDGIKLDRSFVHGAAASAKLRAIYDTCLALGKGLNMQVIADGIGDRGDWELLRRTGCDLAQGPLIAKPMLAEDFAGWAAAWNARLHAQFSHRV